MRVSLFTPVIPRKQTSKLIFEIRHCQNLKPAYEKVATSLSGFAKVAAINCDEEPNKAFCGSMGVTGFPTLKIVKPATKPGGKPIVEDYAGPRTAKAIIEIVGDKIPNHVSRLKDDGWEKWLSERVNMPKALFFGQKAHISPLVRSLAIDFLHGIDFAYVRSSEKAVVKRFGAETFPMVLLLPGGTGVEAIKYDGDMKKEPLVEFFSQIMPPHPDAAPEQPKKTKAKNDTKKDNTSRAVKEGKPGPKPSAASETLESEINPMKSPDPNVATDHPSPVQLPITPAPIIQSLDTEDAMQRACLHTKSSTCILAFLPSKAGEDVTSESSASTLPIVQSLSEIVHKHAQRGAKLFPFYIVPDTNIAAQAVTSALCLKGTESQVTVLAINGKRSWWNKYEDQESSRDSIEAWIDGIRFGENTKVKLPDGIIREMREKVAKEVPVKIEVVEVFDEEHDEL